MRDDLTIDARWSLRGHRYLLVFALAWNAILVVWYTLFPAFEDLFVILTPLVLVGIGLSLIYAVIARLLNHTRVELAGDRLSVRSGPLPWWGNRTVNAGQIDQLHCRERIRYYAHETPIMGYDVEAVLRSGDRLRLVSTLDTMEQARFVESQIEECLGIPDVPE